MGAATLVLGRRSPRAGVTDEGRKRDLATVLDLTDGTDDESHGVTLLLDSKVYINSVLEHIWPPAGIVPLRVSPLPPSQITIYFDFSKYINFYCISGHFTVYLDILT